METGDSRLRICERVADTTTSVPIMDAGFRSTDMTVEEDSTRNSCVSNPTDEIINVTGKDWTVSLKFPWLSVYVPLVPPLIKTEAAGTGSLLSPLLIFPVMVWVCAKELLRDSKKIRQVKKAGVKVFMASC